MYYISFTWTLSSAHKIHFPQDIYHKDFFCFPVVPSGDGSTNKMAPPIEWTGSAKRYRCFLFTSVIASFRCSVMLYVRNGLITYSIALFLLNLAKRRINVTDIFTYQRHLSTITARIATVQKKQKNVFADLFVGWWIFTEYASLNCCKLQCFSINVVCRQYG